MIFKFILSVLFIINSRAMYCDTSSKTITCDLSPTEIVNYFENLKKDLSAYEAHLNKYELTIEKFFNQVFLLPLDVGSSLAFYDEIKELPAVKKLYDLSKMQGSFDELNEKISRELSNLLQKTIYINVKTSLQIFFALHKHLSSKLEFFIPYRFPDNKKQKYSELFSKILLIDAFNSHSFLFLDHSTVFREKIAEIIKFCNLIDPFLICVFNIYVKFSSRNEIPERTIQSFHYHTNNFIIPILDNIEPNLNSYYANHFLSLLPDFYFTLNEAILSFQEFMFYKINREIELLLKEYSELLEDRKKYKSINIIAVLEDERMFESLYVLITQKEKGTMYQFWLAHLLVFHSLNNKIQYESESLSQRVFSTLRVLIKKFAESNRSYFYDIFCSSNLKLCEKFQNFYIFRKLLNDVRITKPMQYFAEYEVATEIALKKPIMTKTIEFEDWKNMILQLFYNELPKALSAMLLQGDFSLQRLKFIAALMEHVRLICKKEIILSEEEKNNFSNQAKLMMDDAFVENLFTNHFMNRKNCHDVYNAALNRKTEQLVDKHYFASEKFARIFLELISVIKLEEIQYVFKDNTYIPHTFHKMIIPFFNKINLSFTNGRHHEILKFFQNTKINDTHAFQAPLNIPVPSCSFEDFDYKKYIIDKTNFLECYILAYLNL